MVEGCLSVTQAQPVDFKCAKAGTVQIRPWGTVQGTVLATGTSPTDPYVCTFLGFKRQPLSLLFGFYSTEGPDITSIRPAMLELFSDRKTSVSFDFTDPNQIRHHHTWTFLRRE